MSISTREDTGPQLENSVHLQKQPKFINICRQSGYNQSFLVAFNNGERITDAEAKVLEAQLSKKVHHRDDKNVRNLIVR